MLEEPGVEVPERLEARERVLVFLLRGVDGDDAVGAGIDVVAADAHREALAVAVGAPGLGEHLPVIVHDVVEADLLVLGVRRIEVPRARQQVARIRHRRDRNDAVHGRQQAHAALLDRDSRDVLDVGLHGQAIRDAHVEAGAREFRVAGGVVDAVLGLRVGRVNAQPDFPLGPEAAADVERAADLAEGVAGHRDARHVDLARALGDEVDDARGARHAEHERVGALQRLDALLVLGGYRDHADGRQAAVQAIVGKEVQLDAADVDRIVRRSLGVRGRHAGHTLDRFRITFLRRLLELLARGDRLGHGKRLLVAELLLVVFGLDRPGVRRGRIRAVQRGHARDAAREAVADPFGVRAQARLVAGPAQRKDDGDGAHHVAGRVAHRKLRFQARAVRAHRELGRAAADHREVARVGFLADAADVGCDDRIAFGLRVFQVQHHDEHAGLLLERVVDEVLCVGVDGNPRVVLGGCDQVLGAVGDAPGELVAHGLGLLHQGILVGAGDVGKGELDHADGAARHVAQLHRHLDVVVAGLVDLDARLAGLEHGEVVGIGGLADAIARLRRDDRALRGARRDGMDVDLEELGMARGGAVDQVLRVILAPRDRRHGLGDIGAGLRLGGRGHADHGGDQALRERHAGDGDGCSFHLRIPPRRSVAKVRKVPEATLTRP